MYNILPINKINIVNLKCMHLKYIFVSKCQKVQKEQLKMM